MMFKPKSNKWHAAKVLYLLPVMALTLVAFAKPTSPGQSSPTLLPSDENCHQPSASTFTLDFTKPNESNVSIKGLVRLDPFVLRIDGDPVTSPLSGDWLNGIDLSNVRVTQDEQGNIVQMDLHSKANATPKAASLADDDKIYDNVEVMPAFPGGTDALFNWLTNNIRYPEVALKQKVQGKAFVRFVVEKDGSITDVQTVKSPSSQLLSDEAQRVVKLMPRWEPGKVKGKPVRTHFILPITFKLPK